MGYDINEHKKKVRKKLNAVQEIFDEYQKECFVQRTPEFFCLELNGEAGELANFEKKRWKGRNIPMSAFEDEAADVAIALMNYCNAKGVDLGRAVADKLLVIEEKRQYRLSKGQDY